MSEHPSHKKQLPRLNRASGQLEGIKRMIEDGRYCVDILTQLRAVRSAIKTIELDVLEAHINACLAKSSTDENATSRDAQLAEIMTLLKKYE